MENQVPSESLNFFKAASNILPGATETLVTRPETGFGLLVSGLISAVMVIGALLVLLYLIWGAIDWITAGGDSGKIQKAREKITQSVIGIIVLASTIALFTFIQRFLGISVLNFRNSSGTNPGGGNGGGTASGCNASTEGTVVTDSSNNYGYCTTGGVSLRCVPPGYAGPQYTSHTWNPCGCTSGAPRAGYKFANCQGPLQ
jgi:hypothetical protein